MIDLPRLDVIIAGIAGALVVFAVYFYRKYRRKSKQTFDNPSEYIIRFASIYPKILDEHNDVVETAVLLDVGLVTRDSLSQSYLDYDTDGGKFTLSRDDKFLMLLFLKPPECEGVCATNLFATLRRATPENTWYFRSGIGREFMIMIDSPKQ